MKTRRLGLIAFMAVVAALIWFALRTTADDAGSDASATAESSDGRPGSGLKAVPKSKRSSTRTPVWERPSATVSGRVVNEDDQPIAGAQVCASTSSRDLNLELRRKVPCVKAGSDGRFQLTGLHPVTYSLGASAPEHIPATWRDERDDKRLSLSAGETRKDLVITLESGGVQIHGVVKDIAGGVIEGALVSAGGGGGGFWFSTSSSGAAVTHSDENGRFSLWVRPGGGTVHAKAEGYADASQTGATPGHDFEIFLSPESVLVGRVVDAQTGKPVAGAFVSLGGGGFFRNNRANTTMSAEDGRFRIDRLEPGVFKVRASTESGYGTSDVKVHLGLGQQSDEIEVPLHPAGAVYGSIKIAATGELCTNGSLSVTSKETDYSNWGRIKPDGSVRVEGLRPATYKVRAYCDDYLSKDTYDDITIEAGDSIEGQWEVDEAHEIAGRVVDADGEPVAEAWVRATPTSVEGRDRRTSGSEKTKKDGTFRLQGLIPGEYELRGNAPYDSRQGKATATITEASDADVTIELAAGATVRGVVVDDSGAPVANVGVRDKGPTQGWASETTDDEGKFEFAGLPAGQHRFYATEQMWGSDLRAPGTTDDDIQGVTVDLAEEGEEEITITVESRGGEIRGRVVDDAGGPVADAFIRSTRESDSAAAGMGNNVAQARWGGWFETPVMTDEDGQFTLTNLPEDAEFTVYAHRKGGGEGIAEHIKAGASGVEISIAATGSISGKVTLADGSIPDEVTVNIQDKKLGIDYDDTFYRTDGVFRFENVSAGEYEIVASTAKGDASVTKKLEEGGKLEGIELELTSRVTVKGRVIDADTKEPINGLMVSVQKDGGSFSFRSGDHGEDAKHITDSDGRFEVERAPTGPVTLMIMHRSFGAGDYNPLWTKRTIGDEDPFELPTVEMIKKRLEDEEQAGDLGLKLKDNDAGEDWTEGDLTVAVVRPGGPAQEAGVKVGDVIESVDGHDVTGENKSRYYSLSRVKTGTKLKMGLAGGRSVELVVGKPL